MAPHPVHRQRRRPAQHRKPRPPINPMLGAAGRLAGCSTVAAATTLGVALTPIAAEPVAALAPSTAAPSAPVALGTGPSAATVGLGLGMSTAVVAQHPLVAPAATSGVASATTTAVRKTPLMTIALARYGSITRRSTVVTSRTPSSARTSVGRSARSVTSSTRTAFTPMSPAARVMASPSRRALIPTFKAQAAKQGVQADLLMATCWMESGWQPQVVSSTGAVGLCQIMPATGRFISQQLLHRSSMDARDPAQNIAMSAAYQRYLLNHVGGSNRLMLASYYQGLWRTQHRGLLPDTVRYVTTITRLQPQFTPLAGSNRTR